MNSPDRQYMPISEDDAAAIDMDGTYTVERWSPTERFHGHCVETWTGVKPVQRDEGLFFDLTTAESFKLVTTRDETGIPDGC